MRFLHTSDWHLGNESFRQSRQGEYERFLQWLTSTIQQEQVDVLLISGDLYDTQNPSIASQRLFMGFLAAVTRANPQLVVIATAGNHDSSHRVAMPAPLCEALGHIHLIGAIQQLSAGVVDLDSLIIPIGANPVQAVVAAVPYVRPGDLMAAVQEGETPGQAYHRALAELYTKLDQRIQEKFGAIPRVAMGHMTVLGGERSSSERALVGGLEDIPLRLLASGSWDYIALGHLHRAQRLGDRTAYSGSPFAMDFSEAKNAFQVLIWENKHIRSIPVPTFLPIHQWSGTLEDLKLHVQSGTFQHEHQAIELIKDTQIPLRLEILGGIPGSALRKEIQDLLLSIPNRPYQLIQLQISRSLDQSTQSGNDSDLDADPLPQEVFNALLKALKRPESNTLQRCFQEACASVSTGEEAAP